MFFKACSPAAGTGEGTLCSVFSPSFVQWEAMTFFLESVINQMFRTLEKEVSNDSCAACIMVISGICYRAVRKSVDLHLTEEGTEVRGVE